MAQQQEQKDIWSADLYGEKVAPFVATSTDKILAWLDPNPTDEILDIGSGEGPLTARIAPYVKRIVGIDGSANMIEHFKKAYPHIESRVVDCRLLDQETDLTTGNFDKVFSNAALHWILRDPETRPNTIKGCFEALKPGGLLVSESGALGNVAEVHSAIISGLVTQGIPVERAREASPWWFPSQQAMKELVEGAGFDWIKGEVQLRQTTLTENEKGGVEGWIRLFGEPFLGLLSTTEARDAAVKHAVDVLEAVGRQQHDGSFTVNYIRLRFVARKPE
ncbi:S-adenosyl-L-methionine-dependent methyltransferase [Penicillium sp. CMV-2018d]|nr:S-adenosyl-L-methionine-dependent methyltransferase [Penicillium sp. CMV-2018d]